MSLEKIIRNIENNLEELKTYSKTIIQKNENQQEIDIGKIIGNIENNLQELKIYSNSVITANNQQTPKNEKIETNNLSDFEKLKVLLNSDDWPQAAPEFLICEDSEQDKNDRAEGIVSYIGIDLKDKKFLDFGCGEGHVAQKIASLETIKSYGFDINKSGILPWEEVSNNFLLTTDFEKIKAEGPYDVVLLYDVLDHCENPMETLNKIREITTNDSRIYIRCHPFCSRHGTHLYKKLNKAYVHMVFSDEELASMGYKNDIAQKTLFPVAQNNTWFSKTGYKVVSHDTVKTLVEDFFKQNKLISARATKKEYNNKFPEYQMSQVFNDYILQKIS